MIFIKMEGELVFYTISESEQREVNPSPDCFLKFVLLAWLCFKRAKQNVQQMYIYTSNRS